VTSEAPQPRSRRERPAKSALTGPGIVATAVEIMRGEGLGRVTMRRLAHELDTGPASLYVYFRNTAELHAAVLDELLGEVDLSPAAEPGEWRDRLVRVLTSYIGVLYANPSLARTALVVRPRGRHYLDLVETLLAMLHEGGLATGRAAWALDMLLQFATRALRAVDEHRYPRTAAAREELFSGTPETRLAWNFQVLLNGILATPVPR
jgi:AcrR family transcriptional regulator